MRALPPRSLESSEAGRARFPDADALTTPKKEEAEPAEPTLSMLEQKLEEEEGVYAEFLARVDELSRNPAPFDRDPGIPGLLAELNASEALRPEEAPRPRGGLLRRVARKLLAPELEALDRALTRQRRFDSILVQVLNRLSETANGAAARSAEFASALVGFSQRIDRVVDAKDRLYASLGNRRADLLLDAMEKRLETVRLGIERARERMDGMSSALALARAELGALASNEAPKASRERMEDARYVAFEDRFRGSSEEIRERLSAYVPFFEGRAPVLDLGCGRGEFLELSRDAGIVASGVDGNEEMVRLCRAKGLDAAIEDVLEAVSRREPASLGGIFAAQLIEHLPPRAIASFLSDCHRALRPGGRVILETVNPRSLVALVESFYRDLTHEKPIHPETLDFALRGAGFSEVETRYSSPVPERARLLPVASNDAEAGTVNRNFEKLNAFLFGEQDYAAIATK
jgi:O-antigen chain-terminating methyltransferase